MCERRLEGLGSLSLMDVCARNVGLAGLESSTASWWGQGATGAAKLEPGLVGLVHTMSGWPAIDDGGG